MSEATAEKHTKSIKSGRGEVLTAKRRTTSRKIQAFSNHPLFFRSSRAPGDPGGDLKK